MDAVEAAQSGHPGTPMALAPAAYVLWTRFLRHNPADPAWPDRDRFVLSCGHASMLLYSLLYLSGYELSLDDLGLDVDALEASGSLEDTTSLEKDTTAESGWLSNSRGDGRDV